MERNVFPRWIIGCRSKCASITLYIVLLLKKQHLEIDFLQTVRFNRPLYSKNESGDSSFFFYFESKMETNELLWSTFFIILQKI